MGNKYLRAKKEGIFASFVNYIKGIFDKDEITRDEFGIDADPRETILRNLEISQTFISREFAEALTGKEYADDPHPFQIQYDENDNLILKELEFLLSREPETSAIDISNVELSELIPYALEAFKKHRAAGNFDSKLNPSKKISGKDMQKHLDSNIQYLEQLQLEFQQTKSTEAPDTFAPDPERQEKEESIRKSQAEKLAIEGQIAEIDKEIKELTDLLKQKQSQREILSKSLEER
ncbi:MAG: hypothetical protein ACI4VQ_06895 [Clostridia bacterium]